VVPSYYDDHVQHPSYDIKINTQQNYEQNGNTIVGKQKKNFTAYLDK
jgi:hypothetical protein